MARRRLLPVTGLPFRGRRARLDLPFFQHGTAAQGTNHRQHDPQTGRIGDGAGAGLGRMVAAAVHRGKNGKNSWRNFLTTACSSWLMRSSESQSEFVAVSDDGKKPAFRQNPL